MYWVLLNVGMMLGDFMVNIFCDFYKYLKKDIIVYFYWIYENIEILRGRFFFL